MTDESLRAVEIAVIQIGKDLIKTIDKLSDVERRLKILEEKNP